MPPVRVAVRPRVLQRPRRGLLDEVQQRSGAAKGQPIAGDRAGGADGFEFRRYEQYGDPDDVGQFEVETEQRFVC